MKKSLLLTLMLAFGIVFQSQAQNEDYRINVALSGNYTFTGSVLSGIVETAQINGANIKEKSLPSLQVTADYGISDWFSVGLAASYQKLGFEATGNTYTDANGMQVTENYEYDFKRSSVALRPLFHFANDEKLDMYSGLRVGFFNAKGTSTSNDPDFNDDEDFDFDDVSKITISIVAYGVRYYFTDNIGVGFELNIGRPYVTSFSVNARF